MHYVVVSHAQIANHNSKYNDQKWPKSANMVNKFWFPIGKNYHRNTNSKYIDQEGEKMAHFGFQNCPNDLETNFLPSLQHYEKLLFYDTGHNRHSEYIKQIN